MQTVQESLQGATPSLVIAPDPGLQLVADAVPVNGRQRIRAVVGDLNVPLVQRYANIHSAIRRGLPQARGYEPNPQPICLVGSGPSLASTLDELRALAADGCPVVALNGAYGYLLEQAITPTALVLLDARSFNARFITERVEGCSYFLASQCSPSIFDKVAGWPRVYLWHCLTRDETENQDEIALLDDYYLKAWQPVSGGCTVGLRAIGLCRILGFTKQQLFGMDSCYLEDEGHALPQPENDADTRSVIYAEDGRRFVCNTWHVSQALEFVDMIRVNGEEFELAVHGDGLLAHLLRAGLPEQEAVVAQLQPSLSERA